MQQKKDGAVFRPYGAHKDAQLTLTRFDLVDGVFEPHDQYFIAWIPEMYMVEANEGAVFLEKHTIGRTITYSRLLVCRGGELVKCDNETQKILAEMIDVGVLNYDL